MLYSATNKGNITIQIEKPLTGQKEKPFLTKERGKITFMHGLHKPQCPK